MKMKWPSQSYKYIGGAAIVVPLITNLEVTMSIAVAVLGEGYSIVAADTRATNILNNRYHNNASKLLMTDFGWIANSGGVSLHTRFFNGYLKQNKPKNRKDIYIAWLMAAKMVQEFGEKHARPEETKEAYNNMPTSTALYSLNYFKDGKPYMCIEALDFMHKARKLKAVNSLVVSPPKTTKRIKRIIEKYTRRVRKVKGLYDTIYNIACLVHDISKRTKWINSTIDYGISLKLSETEILLMSIRESAKTIKALYREKGDFSEIMMVDKSIGGTK